MMSKQISKYKSDMEVQIKDNKIYAPLKGKWLVTKPEEEVRQKYICRLLIVMVMILIRWTRN